MRNHLVEPGQVLLLTESSVKYELSEENKDLQKVRIELVLDKVPEGRARYDDRLTSMWLRIPLANVNTWFEHSIYLPKGDPPFDPTVRIKELDKEVKKYKDMLEQIASGEHADETVENAREALGTTDEDYL